ncbi:7640_t:CDS:1, partial [Cetraspora pellucida]
SQLKPSVPCNNMNSDELELYTTRQFFWQLGSQDHQPPITCESTNIQNQLPSNSELDNYF